MVIWIHRFLFRRSGSYESLWMHRQCTDNPCVHQAPNSLTKKSPSVDAHCQIFPRNSSLIWRADNLRESTYSVCILRSAKPRQPMMKYYFVPIQVATKGKEINRLIHLYESQGNPWKDFWSTVYRLILYMIEETSTRMRIVGRTRWQRSSARPLTGRLCLTTALPSCWLV